MNELERRRGGTHRWNEEDYVVLCNDWELGRIYKTGLTIASYGCGGRLAAWVDRLMEFRAREPRTTMRLIESASSLLPLGEIELRLR